nr:hypothetical protein [Kineosporia sp. A_224]
MPQGPDPVPDGAPHVGEVVAERRGARAGVGAPAALLEPAEGDLDGREVLERLVVQLAGPAPPLGLLALEAGAQPGRPQPVGGPAGLAQREPGREQQEQGRSEQEQHPRLGPLGDLPQADDAEQRGGPGTDEQPGPAGEPVRAVVPPGGHHREQQRRPGRGADPGLGPGRGVGELRRRGEAEERHADAPEDAPGVEDHARPSRCAASTRPARVGASSRVRRLARCASTVRRLT